MPITPPGQSTGSSLADLLGNVDRPQLNAFVANSQARNGLVSAQTQDAMIKASQAQEQMQAWEQLKQDAINNGMKESSASLFRDATVAANNHDPETALKVNQQFMLMYGTPQEQAQGQQGVKGQIMAPEPVQPNTLPVPGVPGTPGAPAYAGMSGANAQQTPDEAAKTAEMNALAALNTHKNIDPAAFRAPGMTEWAAQNPDKAALLTNAVREGRLDPTRLNSRTAPILAGIEAQAPGTQYNQLHAAAALQSNPTFQNRAQGLEIMPGILKHVVELGKALDGGAGYSDLRTVGKMQQFMNGELNDPAYAEYMPVRNDAILRLAYFMRGQGASNQAAALEHEAWAPTLAPYALDSWLKGQMSVLTPMIDKNNQTRHLGEPGQGPQPLNAPPAAGAEAPPAGPPPLGSTVPTPGGAPPVAATTAAGAPPAHVTLQDYPTEEAARAAGHGHGDRVKIGGVPGTLN